MYSCTAWWHIQNHVPVSWCNVVQLWLHMRVCTLAFQNMDRQHAVLLQVHTKVCYHCKHPFPVKPRCGPRVPANVSWATFRRQQCQTWANKWSMWYMLHRCHWITLHGNKWQISQCNIEKTSCAAPDAVLGLCVFDWLLPCSSWCVTRSQVTWHQSITNEGIGQTKSHRPEAAVTRSPKQENSISRKVFE